MRKGGLSSFAATAAAAQLIAHQRRPVEIDARADRLRQWFAQTPEGPQPRRQHPAILAWANDEGFERVFVEQLKNLATADDMLIVFSGSGNSENVLCAIDWANHARLRTWGITGFDGGKLRDLARNQFTSRSTIWGWSNRSTC